jgi:GNAT superfamily N-acetyltransferase
MGQADLLRRVCDARAAYNQLGTTVVEQPCARFVCSPDTPQVHDANIASWVRAETDGEIDGVLARADEVYADVQHRKVMIDPDTPAAFEARLVLEGYEPHPHLELVLEGDLRAAPSGADLRLVESQGDWQSLTVLWQLDHDEEEAKGQHDPWAPVVTEQMVASKRMKAPDLRFWLARVDDTDAAFFSSWPGQDGMGIVEDLFTRPEFRGRGIATTLIAHAVADARERGAGPVAISARTTDTPKHMYAALGFHPSGISRSYLRTIE